MNNTSRFVYITNLYYCPVEPVSFSGLSDFVCYGPADIPLTGSGGGTFSGTAMSGSNFQPYKEGVPGTYQTVTYIHNSYPNSPGCSVSKKVLVGRKPVLVDRVLAVSAGTYGDSWPLSNDNAASSAALKALPDFGNGTRGVWRGESSYAYEDKRQASAKWTPYQLRTDGIFGDVELFDHSSGKNGECNVNWRKVNTMTRYNMSSSETENKDILGLSSSALFGYDGKLAVAVAGNAAVNEICYEGFEEYPVTTAGTHVIPSNLNQGNFSFFTTSVSSNDFPARTLEFDIVQAKDNVLTVACPYAESSRYFTVGMNIKVFGAGLVSYHEKNINGSYPVLAVQADPSNAGQCLVLLSNSFTVSTVWKGKLSLQQNMAARNPYTLLTSNLSVVESTPSLKAHSGSKMLRLSSVAAIEQTNLKITAGKNIVFSAWLRINTGNLYTYDITGQRVRLSFTDESQTILSYTDFRPVGNIIEGWQKVEGQATVPAGASRLILTLSTDGNAAYWDDIRIFPSDGQLQSYVYRDDYKVSAILDGNNYATYYYYDEQGNLYLTKKETERGVMTIKENFSHQYEK